MVLNPERIGTREKLILAGLYLSKYDSLGLRKLGSGSFTEAFNVIGYAMGSQPASLKNYRDEFDPLFPNRRKGWHKRPRREYCLRALEEYKGLDLESFTGLVKSFFGYDENAWSEIQQKEEQEESGSSFAKRLACDFPSISAQPSYAATRRAAILGSAAAFQPPPTDTSTHSHSLFNPASPEAGLITGLAAERYFVSVHSAVPEFGGYTLEDTTHLGCGYDFRLRTAAREDFLAVEVKGLRESAGSLSLTTRSTKPPRVCEAVSSCSW
jgi:hypothetical protein